MIVNIRYFFVSLRMRYVKKLIEAELVTLQEAQKNSSKAHFRDRCLAIELSSSGKSVPYIADLLNTRTDTVYTWMNRWDSMGITGLKILSGRGLKAKLDILLTDFKLEAIELIKKNSRQSAEVGRSSIRT